MSGQGNRHLLTTEDQMSRFYSVDENGVAQRTDSEETVAGWVEDGRAVIMDIVTNTDLSQSCQIEEVK